MILNKATRADFEIFRGAPLPINVWESVKGVIRSFDATLTLIAEPKDGSPGFTLTVGQGIALSAIDAVANALATILLTPAQSLLVKEGAHTRYSLVEGPPQQRVVLSYGDLIGTVMPK